MKTLLILVISIFVIASCNQSPQHAHSHEATAQYTCPMHPDVKQDAPGTCPVCGMDLVPVTAQGTSTSAAGELMLSDHQMRMANVTVAPVRLTSIGDAIAINGRLTPNRETLQTISSRGKGRIERLFVKETGRAIRKGQPLYSLYSEELLTLQQEYLLAKAQADLAQAGSRYRSIMEAAERKLLLFGLTRAQIAQLNNAGDARPVITFLSPAEGVVTAIDVSEGAYVSEGTPMYRLDETRSLWVEAELYPGETQRLSVGDMVDVEVAGVKERIRARISFVSPGVSEGSQITVVRAEIANTKGTLKAGLHAQIFPANTTNNKVSVPANALITDQNGSHVYVQSGQNTFRPRRVSPGTYGDNLVEITEGLSEDDTVAVSGAYLLYSEFILKKGADPLASHKH